MPRLTLIMFVIMITDKLEYLHTLRLELELRSSCDIFMHWWQCPYNCRPGCNLLSELEDTRPDPLDAFVEFQWTSVRFKLQASLCSKHFDDIPLRRLVVFLANCTPANFKLNALGDSVTVFAVHTSKL